MNRRFSIPLAGAPGFAAAVIMSVPRAPGRGRIAALRIGLAAFALVTASVAIPSAGEAEPDLFGRGEATLAVPLSAPQTDRFYPGFQGLVNGGLSFDWVDLKLTALVLALPDKDTPTSHDSSVVGGFGGGVRLKVPDGRYRFTPWLDTDLLYARSSSLNRLGYSVALGAHATPGRQDWLQLGPVIRFTQIVDSDQSHFDSRDAFLLSMGLSVELGHVSTPWAASQAAVASSTSSDRSVR
jgi:hypothetical protein